MANKMDIEVRKRQKEMHSEDNALQAFKRSHAKSKALEGMKKGGTDWEKGPRKMHTPNGKKQSYYANPNNHL